MNSKSSSSTSTIIEYFGTSYMNFDKSWIMNCGSSLREKEENFDNLCCESSLPTVEYHVRLARFEQRWNEDESSSVHRETVAFTMRVNPSHFEKQQRQQRQQQSYVNTSENKVKLKKRKESFEKTKLGLWFLDDIDVTVKKREQRIGRVQNPKINWKENSRVRHWSHCLCCRSFNSLNWAIFVRSEDHKRMIPQRKMNYANILCKSTIHQNRGSSTRSLL